MARRRGKPGDYLMTSDYSGVTEYASKLTKDFWGDYGEFNLKRNLQEIASPLNDPYPVPIYRGPSYEPTTACDFETQPLFIGKTNKPFPTTDATQILNLDPGIGLAEIGCTFIVH